MKVEHVISDRIKKRLRKDRPMTAITLRIQQDVVDDLKEMAPLLGFSGYQALLKAYVSDGMRRDEAKLFFQTKAKEPARRSEGGKAGEIEGAMDNLDAVIKSAEEARQQLNALKP